MRVAAVTAVRGNSGRGGTGGVTWGRFQRLRIPGTAGWGAGSERGGEPLSFAVQRNPVHPDTLAALFPLADGGCIGFATSYDGVHWSAASSLVGCGAHDRPVSGGLVRQGSSVHLYVHKRAPGGPQTATRWLHHAVGGEPTLVRYTISAQQLLRHTKASHMTIRGGTVYSEYGATFRALLRAERNESQRC